MKAYVCSRCHEFGYLFKAYTAMVGEPLKLRQRLVIMIELVPGDGSWFIETKPGSLMIRVDIFPIQMYHAVIVYPEYDQFPYLHCKRLTSTLGISRSIHTTCVCAVHFWGGCIVTYRWEASYSISTKPCCLVDEMTC